jgi:hypothetical protein
MSQINQTTKTELSVSFVQADYFLNRIHEFENKYQSEWQGWGDFLSAYEKNQVDRSNSDLDEWAFLCNHFMMALIESGRDVGPPGAERYAPQKPESDSGFCFLERDCSRLKAISKPRFESSRPARATRRSLVRSLWSKEPGTLGN